MSLSYFLARRIHFHPGDSGQRVSPPVIRIAIAGIAIGLAVMIVSVAIVIGFKQEVREKVIGFGAHMQLQAMTANTTFETHPIDISDSLLITIQGVEGIERLHPFATKPAILKTEEDFLSIAIKGVTAETDLSFFARHLEEGEMPQLTSWSADPEETLPSRQIVISRLIANRLKLDVGDEISTYFIRSNRSNEFSLGSEKHSVRSRKLQISGIYATHFDEYDKQMIVGDLRLLQELSGWYTTQASGVEIYVKDFDRLQEIYANAYDSIGDYADRNHAAYYLRTIEQINPQIFSWLDLLDTNVWVILLLIAIVAAFTMISGLLIIILERTQMIGILKALGFDNRGLQRMFLYVSLFLIGKGLLWGNLCGIGLCLLQKHFHLIALDPHNYYLEQVPIALNLWHVLLLNIGTISITMLVLLAPTAIVAKIQPSKVMQAD